MILKCLAVDDEPFALQQLADFIRKTPFLELTEKCQNAFDALKAIESHDIDLIFLDINMPEMTGMELAQSGGGKLNVIFTTAYSKYAVESYKVNAIDYLLKPFGYSEFLRAAGKARDLISNRQSPVHEKSEEQEHFFVKSEGKVLKILTSDIEYIESLSEYVRIHLKEQKPVLTLMSLKSLERSLPERSFMRVHRSYIVNLQQISTIERNRILFSENRSVPVADQYKTAFRKFIEQSFL